jgi:prepilin-type N-terminal cleavage/methylation domain-containing protein
MTKRQQQQNLSQSRDGGYTIIESLVAMIVVSVLMIAIAPVMAFSVAIRVQARRVELASQAATGYINALRVGAIKFPPNPQTPTSRFLRKIRRLLLMNLLLLQTPLFCTALTWMKQ